MEVVFLGTGTSQGVPIIAQPKDFPFDFDNPKNWRTRTSVHVIMDGRHIQVDAAPEFRLQCLWNRIEQVDDFILTHGHADHVLGMDDLRRFIDMRGGQALDVYGTDEGLGRVRAIFPYAIRDQAVVKGYPAFRLREMPERLEWPEGTIESCRLPHGSIEVLGLIFREASSGVRFAYFTDCKRVPERGVQLAKGANLVVLDALRPSSHPSHMNVEEAIQTAAQIQAGQTLFTHMTCHLDHDRDGAALPQGMAFAHDGLRVSLTSQAIGSKGSLPVPR